MLSLTARQTSRRLVIENAVRTLAITALRFKSTVPTTTADMEIAGQQAPNREMTWSSDQRPRSEIIRDPRFVQADLLSQPRPMAAIELIAEEPVREVEGRLACCDGGGGPLGHPRVWINLDEGKPESCSYCGLRFQMKPHHHH
ncbi:hypothetical protein J3B02_002705 [Coemansia erecta]|uniref:Zinc finger CHCC-type domain-containing protein n=1 Tax=Coemansia asiatica TaxID=1052880 RepID=A0A9W7XJF4_9FUNG|nr:hypothetical protein LPJ64_004293 [Coemansia asiatica]KAJ2854380.1 hypothetical protein J3B02_002705 [Coemansia erecta]KAJ2886209.1 hypothetical protein FB639_001617 [Coemansia asiatica]